MPRSWSQLLGEENAQPEREAERAGLFSRLRDSLSKSRRALTAELASAAFDPGDDAAWERLEEALIRADVGVPATAELVRRLEARQDLTDLNAALADELAALLGDPGTLAVRADPSVLLVVGVNGTGKTTTIGKLAERLRRHGHTVVLAAADTFRAAAEEQLEIWAERAGAEFVGGERGADPASVAYDAIERATRDGCDVVIVDTAGRLHTQANLMQELTKVHRVIETKLQGAPHETLLVVDATTGQNGLQQARLFGEAVGVTGVALTKLDGSAKGGVAVPIAYELGLPVKLIGVGEPRPRDAAARDGERALAEGVDAEALLDRGPVDRAGDERSEADRRADKVERLAQVRRVHEQHGIRALVAAVLPVAAVEAGGQQEEHLRRGEEGLAGRGRCGERPRAVEVER